MSLEHQEVVSQEAIDRIEADIRRAEEEISVGHEQEGQALLWKALSSASDLKNPEEATKILELLTGKSTQH